MAVITIIETNFLDILDFILSLNIVVWTCKISSLCLNFYIPLNIDKNIIHKRCFVECPKILLHLCLPITSIPDVNKWRSNPVIFYWWWRCHIHHFKYQGSVWMTLSLLSAKLDVQSLSNTFFIHKEAHQLLQMFLNIRRNKEYWTAEIRWCLEKCLPLHGEVRQAAKSSTRALVLIYRYHCLLLFNL